MKNLLLFGLVIALLASAPAIAQNAIDGTWKFNLSDAQFPKKPDVYLLQNGKYQCKTCVPPIDVKADGQDQPVSGDPYLDSVSIKVVDDRTIEEIDKKNGKTVTTSKTVVSPDSKTAAFEFTDSSNTNADPVTGKGSITRVAKGPTGSHAISGSWVTSKMDTLSDNGLVVTFKVEGDSLKMSNQTGQSYVAKMDGTDAPYKGDPGTTSVSVKNAGKNTIEETDKRDGKVISVARMTVAAGGKTMMLMVEDKLRGTNSQFTATKQ
ncbi:MAG TPA: hypothetical protein VMQ17_26615 [Candidatus Sulfotelmatobacter sp.]|jgi:hypothetical protein|nr:hypothetical protein [Candidatus Sulfotelmatobacter sp.]